MAVNEEPLLFIGDTGYKIYQAEKIFVKKSITIRLNQQTKINYLIGSTVFFDKKESGKFYLKNLLNIINEEDKYVLYRQYIDDEGKILEGSIIEELNEKISHNENIEEKKIEIYNKFLEKITTNNVQDNNILEDMILEFKPGIITYSYLGKNNLIFKNISNIDTSILERFNEFFTESQVLNLNEDINNTFTEKDNKLLKLSNIGIISSSYSGTEDKISEAISSRFTTIYMSPYKKEEEYIVLNYILKPIIYKLKIKFLKI